MDRRKFLIGAATVPAVVGASGAALAASTGEGGPELLFGTRGPNGNKGAPGPVGAYGAHRISRVVWRNGSFIDMDTGEMMLTS